MTIKSIEKTEYQELSSQFPLHPLQTVMWADSKAGWISNFFAVYDEDELISLFSLLGREISIFGIKVGYTPRGIFTKDVKYLQEILNIITEKTKELGLDFLLIDPDIDFKYLANITAYKNSLMSAYKGVGFSTFPNQLQPDRTVVINLSKTEEELLSDMRSKHRQYIRKAEKNGVRFRTGEDIERFCEIMKSIGSEKKYVLHTCDYYKTIWENFRKTDQVRLFFVEKGESLLGSYMVLFNSDYVYEMFGGCNLLGNNLKASYLLKWESMKYFKNLGKKFYDQWGAEFRFPGLVQFKEGFGGQVLEFPPQFVFINSTVKYKLFRIFEKLNIVFQKIITSV